MSLDSDVIVDRRRIRRKLTFWRVTAVLVAIAAIASVGVVVTPGGRSTLTTSGSIARINIEGLIRSDQERVEALERLENSRAAAVIVHINSPGGTTAGSEQLYDALVRLKAKKPLVVVVEGLAASGGYITAMAADHIVARQSSLVGSIGVLFQYPNFTELLKTVGVRVEEVKSSPLKAAPNGFEPTSPEARAALDDLVKDSYAWFRGLVKARRGMDEALLDKVSDGRVFTGHQAVDLKLIDQFQVHRLMPGENPSVRNFVEQGFIHAAPRLHQAAKPGIGIFHQIIECRARFGTGRLKSIGGCFQGRGLHL